MVDHVGRTVLSTIREHQPALLPDSTRTVRLAARTHAVGGPTVSLAIDFNRDRALSEVTISSQSTRPRDAVLSASDALHQLLRPAHTLAFFYHPPFGVYMALVAIVPIAALVAAETHRVRASWIVCAIAAILLWFVAGALLNPYTSFDSTHQRRASGAWKWLAVGFLGWVLFGMIAPLVWNGLHSN